MTDRFLFQLGFAALALGVTMMAVPWFGAVGALVVVLAASAIAWRARRIADEPERSVREALRPSSPRDPSREPASQRA